MTGRALAVAAVLLVGALLSVRSGAAESAAPRESLVDFPRHLEGWSGVDAEPFRDDVLAQLGVDEYINRRYVGEGRTPVAVYIGYYATQRQGDTIHSPRNCLPGAGWHPVEEGRVTLARPDGARPEVNRYVISRGAERQVVLYWYQGRGRTVASEYANKLLLITDAMRFGRTTGGLVRIIAPVIATPQVADREVGQFATAVVRHIDRFLP